MRSATPETLWELRLSITTTSPGLRTEHLVEIGEEDFGVGGCFDGHGGEHAVEAHRPQDGEDLPVALGGGLTDTLTPNRL